jgi:hypothetical protein
MTPKPKTPVEQAYLLESLLRVLSLATDGEQIAGKTFEFCGGGSVLDMAADMAGAIVDALEKVEMAAKAQAAKP